MHVPGFTAAASLLEAEWSYQTAPTLAMRQGKVTIANHCSYEVNP